MAKGRYWCSGPKDKGSAPRSGWIIVVIVDTVVILPGMGGRLCSQMVLHSNFTRHLLLCDLKQVPSLLGACVSSSVKWEVTPVLIPGLLYRLHQIRHRKSHSLWYLVHSKSSVSVRVT